MEISKVKAVGNDITNGIFLIILNLTLIFISGFMTIDSEANINSRVGGFLLSFLIPICIVYQTKSMYGLERMLKFGFGYILYLVGVIIIAGLPLSYTTGLTPCLLISLAVLFYGENILNVKYIATQ